MPRVSCGRAGSTPRDRYKYLTQGSAGSCRIWGQVVQAICPLFLRPWGDRLLAPRCIYMIVPQIGQQPMCVYGGGMQPLLPNLHKRCAICRKTGKYGGYRALGFGQFSQGTLQSPFERIWCHQNFTQKKSKSVSKTTCRTKICLVREKKN